LTNRTKADIDLTNAEKVIFTLLANNRSISTWRRAYGGDSGVRAPRVPGRRGTFVGHYVHARMETEDVGDPDEYADKGWPHRRYIGDARRVRQKFGTY